MKVIPEATNALTLESDEYGDSILKIYQDRNRFCITMYRKDQLSNGRVSNHSISSGTIYISDDDGEMLVEMEPGIKHTVYKMGKKQ